MPEIKQHCAMPSSLFSSAVAFSTRTLTASFYQRLVATLPFVHSPRICRAEVIAMPQVILTRAMDQ